MAERMVTHQRMEEMVVMTFVVLTSSMAGKPSVNAPKKGTTRNGAQRRRTLIKMDSGVSAETVLFSKLY